MVGMISFANNSKCEEFGMLKVRIAVAICLALSASVVVAPASASDIVTKQVRFDSGTSGTIIKDRITGYQSISYVLGASAGQVMNVKLDPTNNASYFNVYGPGKGPGDQAIANSSLTNEMVPDLNQFSGVLPESGDYTISVYMMRSAARRNERSDFSLDISISATGAATQLPDKIPVPTKSNDALVSGTDFNATGIIPCARISGQPMGSCEFGVKREGNGNGMVSVFWPEGGSRVIFFEDGTPVYFDQSQADGNIEMTTGRENDLFQVKIGEERFEIPEAVINGG